MSTDSLGQFSVIIPTYQEAKNIQALIIRIAALNFNQQSFEVILVDDNSNDGTVEIVEQLRMQYSWLQLIVRDAKKSLSESVIAGYRHAQYAILVVMDADLSHAPENIIDMLRVLQDSRIDMAIGSRYIRGGSTDKVWPVTRSITSHVAAVLANLLLSTKLKDPLSGFFAIRKSQWLAGDTLNPLGWKIGLEVMLKCHCKNIKEIPIYFSQRLHGKSKLTFKVMWDYLRHISKLAIYLWHSP